MKYNIFINQKALAGQGMDLKDSAILDYIVMYCGSKSPKIEEQRIAGATWINYQALMDEMPLLEITTRQSLTPRIKKIKEAGYITTKLKTINGHKRLFVKLTDKVDSLFMETSIPVRVAYNPVRETRPNNTTIDNTTKIIYKYTLPICLGKTYILRIVNFYGLVWKDMYGFNPDPDLAKVGRMIKTLHSKYSEHQIASLILLHFEWRGASGSDDFVYKRLQGACFPLMWLSTNVDAYKAYIINTLGIKWDDEEAIKQHVESYPQFKTLPKN